WLLGMVVLTAINWVFGLVAVAMWAVVRWTNFKPEYLSPALMLMAGAMLARAPWPSESYAGDSVFVAALAAAAVACLFLRSEEHTSELQSRFDLVCRLLL